MCRSFFVLRAAVQCLITSIKDSIFISARRNFMIMRELHRQMLYTVLNTSYGEHAQDVKAMILEEAQAGTNSERVLTQAATLIAMRTSSFNQAKRITRDWADIN
jgi:hypothetical protein